MSSIATPTQTPPACAESASASELLNALWRVAQGVQVYGEDHAATRGSAERAATSAGALTSGATRVRAVLDSRTFVVGGDVLSEATAQGTLEAFSMRARTLRIGAIEFAGTPIAEDFRLAGATIALRPADRPWSVEDADSLHARTGGRVRIAPATYEGLRLATGDDGPPRVSRWSRLADAMTASGDAPDSGGVDDLEQLAASLQTSIDKGDASLDDLGIDLTDSVRWSAPDRRAIVAARARVIVQSLRPELRESFAGVRLGMGPRGASRFDALTDVLPASEVIDALERTGDPSVLLCRESVRMISRLVSASESDPVATDRLLVTIDRAAHASGELRAALTELLRSKGTVSFTPLDYQVRLDALLRPVREKTGIDAPPPLSLVWQDEGPHVALVGADLLIGLEPGGADAAALIALLDASMERLAEGGHLAELRGAVERAGACLHEASHPGVSTAAANVFARLGAPGMAERLASAGLAHPGAAEHAIALIRLAGPIAIAVAVRASLDTPGALRDGLVTMLADPGLDVTPIAGELARIDPGLVLRLIELPGFPASVSQRLLSPLIESRDDTARLRAFRSLGASRREWTSAELEMALRDHSPAIRTLGLGAAPKTPGAGHVLIAFVAGDLGARPTTDEFWIAHSLLATHPGPETDRALLGIALGLLKSSPIRNLARAWIALTALAEIRSMGLGSRSHADRPGPGVWRSITREPLAWVSIARDLLRRGERA